MSRYVEEQKFDPLNVARPKPKLTPKQRAIQQGLEKRKQFLKQKRKSK